MRLAKLLLFLSLAFPTFSIVSAGTDFCIQGGLPPTQDECPTGHHWDNQACRWLCNADVNCFVNPCDIAAAKNICPLKSCVADYSHGCNFKCSKCSQTCANKKCPRGTECVQDDECNRTCQPKTNSCIQGGAPPAECSAEGQYEWDNKACKWQCKCRSNEGNWVSIGDQYYSQCNSCQCLGNGQSICTKKGCLDTCFDDQGKGYNINDTIKQNCNTCTCASNGQWGCTKMACPIATTPEPRQCIQGGPVPDVCSEEGQYHWDSKTCRFICNQPVNCLIDPCDNAVRDGLCTREACVADYWTGCNFICNANTTAPTAAPTSSGPDRCIQGGAPPAECSAPGQYEWDNKACKWRCKNPVNCLIDPCQNADRDGVCPKKFCTADYSQGCNFKCSKCSLTCATVKCAGGTECVQDDECKVQCRPLPTAAPTSSGPNVCIQGGAPPAECSGPGQFEWDNKACRWQCKCRSNEGNWVSIGDQYKYKCNSCQCAAGGQPGICTKMGCTATCYDDQGNGYAQGDTRKQDCNTCTCGRDGNWACTEMACSTPTPAPPGPDMCIQGGQVPPECPTTNVWDSKACQFVCVPPPSHCSTSCASTTCLTGTVCEQDQDCNVMCTSRCPDLCPSGICGAGAACVMNHETCSAECKPTECQDVCTSNTCSKGKACRMIINALDQCETQCFTTSGIIVLSATFRVTMTRRSNTIDDVYSAMRRIAADAGADVLAALVISNDNIIKKSGNSINYQWLVKIGIKGATSTERQALLSRYIATATNTLKQAQTANADDNTAATVDSEAALTTEETMMAMQSCPDGSEISVADQCPVSTLAVPAASSSSSSSSTPLVAIIVPIVAGVVLIAVIATAVVIIRRRANTIKSMTNVQQETQMAQRV